MPKERIEVDGGEGVKGYGRDWCSGYNLKPVARWLLTRKAEDRRCGWRVKC